MISGTPAFTAITEFDTLLQVLIASTLIFGLAYLLNALNYTLIRALEGYPFRTQFPFDTWEQAYRNRASTVRDHIKQCTNAISDVEGILPDVFPRQAQAPFKEHRKALQSRKNALVIEQLYAYPINGWRILPTSLGNVIAAAEDYPQLLFGIDSVLMWPYLRPILTKSGYAKFIEREKSAFDLLMNSMVLTIVLGLEISCSRYLRLRSFTAAALLICNVRSSDCPPILPVLARGRRMGDYNPDCLRTTSPSIARVPWLASTEHLRRRVVVLEQCDDFFRDPANASTSDGSKTLFDYAGDEDSILVRVEN